MHTTGNTHALVKVFEINNNKSNILHNTKYLSCIKKTSQGLELFKKESEERLVVVHNGNNSINRQPEVTAS